LYTGITTDVARRFAIHDNELKASAKYLRNKGPLSLAYQACVGRHSLALRVERAIKKLPKTAKERIVKEACGAPDLLKQLGLGDLP